MVCMETLTAGLIWDGRQCPAAVYGERLRHAFLDYGLFRARFDNANVAGTMCQ